jgi:hypothetical protein
MQDGAKVTILKLAKQLSLQLSHLSCRLGHHDEVINVCKNDETGIVNKDTLSNNGVLMNL